MKSRLVLLSLLALSAPLAAQTAVDTSGAGALIAQGMEHSEVMQNLQYLSDVIGPRLTGSAAARKANDWTAERFKAYGLTAHLEEWSFGLAWTRGRCSSRSPLPLPAIWSGTAGPGPTAPAARPWPVPSSGSTSRPPRAWRST